MSTRFGVPICSKPNDPESLYFRCMFHTFFFGPFKSEEELVRALQALDKADPMWDYDCFCIHRGDPNSTDWVSGLPFVSQEERARIEAARTAGEIRNRRRA